MLYTSTQPTIIVMSALNTFNLQLNYYQNNKHYINIALNILPLLVPIIQIYNKIAVNTKQRIKQLFRIAYITVIQIAYRIVI